MNTFEDLISVPLTAQVRTLAQQVAEDNLARYQKTLGLCACIEYLRYWMSYEIDLDHRYLDLKLSDVITVAGVGRIGCVVIDAAQTFEFCLDEHPGDLGVIVVEINGHEARFWGFLPLADRAEKDQVAWSEVQPLDTLLEVIG
ncbi:hypothetical protein ACQ4M3_07930 [Leptolyngbya sp. AN03gr2]|uniref:hypothetical protein n=1 Tax=unclassified Leptolyngbya TaxID=2650499 RepID=UPI003D31B8E8